MRPGAENRKKTIAAGALGTVALLCLVYVYNTLFAGPSESGPAPATTTSAPAVRAANTAPVATTPAKPATPARIVPGVAAMKMASTSASLDPSLDQSAMLRTESLVYSGSGRNIFSATYPAPLPILPKPQFKVRPVQQSSIPPPPPPQPQTCPPACPPMNLKFFGTATRAGGARQAFLLQGEDVYLASQGDIVARKYKIVNINANNIQVTDLQNNNTQTLPLQTQ